ncbi:hypothetical protein [Streptomyces sp. NPDC002215]|uniref:hypothetical protein n=1 Tax=Streptomyces sp. NPDC002215 TaxID=3154412 RepID=UPI003322A5A8
MSDAPEGARYKYSGKEQLDGLYYYGVRNAAAQIEPTASVDQNSASGAEVTDLGLIPATEVKSEDIGTLSLRHVDGQPQLVVSGGTLVPAELTVVDGAGNAVAAYAAAAPRETGPSATDV